MAKDPAFLFYPSDFLTGTMFMSNEQIGIYIRLLCSQHQHGGIIDKDSFNALVGNNLLIKNKFIETEAGFYNERLTIEMDKRNKKSNNMSDTAKEVWKKRKLQKQYNSEEIEGKCNTNVKENDTIVIQPVNVNRDVNENTNKNESKVKKYFDEFETSFDFEQICMVNRFTKENVDERLEAFQKICDSDYPTYKEFVRHFRNWLAKHPPVIKKIYKPENAGKLLDRNGNEIKEII